MRPSAVVRYIEARHICRLNDATRATLAALIGADVRAETRTALASVGVSDGTALSWCNKKRLPPPYAWRMLGRAIHMADRLQRDPDASLTRIAHECGYRDHTSVHHTLRKAFGLSADRVRTLRGQAPLVARWWERQTRTPARGGRR